MFVQVEKPKETKSRTITNSIAQQKNNVKQGFAFTDDRLEGKNQKRLQLIANSKESDLKNRIDSTVIQRTKGDVKGNFVDIPSGEITAERKIGNKLGAMFNMKANFELNDEASEDADCSKGVFVQYVSGKFIINGESINHRLPFGNKLDENLWNLDGPADTDNYYGKRGWNGDRASQYTPHPNGGKFSGSDFPGLNVSEDEYGIVDLRFKAQLLDTGRKLILKERLWSVKGMYSGTEMEKGYEADIEDNDQ
jgi:hypothetical protein